jgi:hypothetical protein
MLKWFTHSFRIIHILVFRELLVLLDYQHVENVEKDARITELRIDFGIWYVSI